MRRADFSSSSPPQALSRAEKVDGGQGQPDPCGLNPVRPFLEKESRHGGGAIPVSCTTAEPSPPNCGALYMAMFSPPPKTPVIVANGIPVPKLLALLRFFEKARTNATGRSPMVERTCTYYEIFSFVCFKCFCDSYFPFCPEQRRIRTVRKVAKIV